MKSDGFGLFLTYLPKSDFRLVLIYSHCAREFLIVEKIQPNLIPSKIIPIGRVYLDSKIKYAIHYLKKT